MLQNNPCRNSKFWLIWTTRFVMQNMLSTSNFQSFDNYESCPLFSDLLQEIHLVLSEKQFCELCDSYFLDGL